MTVPFGDLRREIAQIRDPILSAVAAVLDSGCLVLGPEVEAFEQEFAHRLGLPHAVGVASGTEAITLALMALDVGPGDEVIVPANTCMPTAVGVVGSGASLRLADCAPDRLTISVESVAAAITSRTRAVVPVHMYGNAADMIELRALADSRGLAIVEDCAQAVGTVVSGQPAGSFGEAAAFSFYPTKNLGAYGDAGCVVTASPAVDDRLRRLRNYGYERRDVSLDVGLNSRLDPVQAAVLRVKLGWLDAWNRRRRAIATRYTEALEELDVRLPAVPDEAEHGHHLFVILTRDRHGVRSRFHDLGIQTSVHYPVPLHLQPALAGLGYRAGDFPSSEQACNQVVSLPIYPQLTDEEVGRIVDSFEPIFGHAQT